MSSEHEQDSKPEEPPRRTTFSGESGESILEAISRRTGKQPGVSLVETGGDDEQPILDPRVADVQAQLRTEQRHKYQVLGEIARGGMGAILRGHDKELGREVAMKVVHPELSDRAEVIERFVEEAQVGGQLQHPGIVPVYEMGLLADERPYFTMKLIKGHTLSKLLARRKSPEEDRARFLGIFVSICQTVAYAHSKGVVHRDLKPANVMVGSFGEVQVVDWGLAKVLRRGGVDDEIAASQEGDGTLIETVRSGPNSGSDSLVGNVLGTPAYMAPEQARGQLDQLDERADVFALGAILCELLTGQPPYVPEEGDSLVRMAPSAELGPAQERIESCSAAEALQQLCLACLAPARGARPAGAEELADAVQAHLGGLEKAAHEAQLAAAEQRLRAERSRRRTQGIALAGLLLVSTGAGLWFQERQKRRQESELTASLDELRADVLQLERSGQHREALEAAKGGLRLVETGAGNEDLKSQAERLLGEAQANLEAVEASLAKQRGERLEEERRLERERVFLDFLADTEMRQVLTGLTTTDAEIDREYAQAFTAFGLDLSDPEIGQRVLELQDTEVGIRIALGADSWGRLLRRMGVEDRDFDLELLAGIALDLDTDPLRSSIRTANETGNGAELESLTAEAQGSGTSAETLVLLASSLADQGRTVLARQVLLDGADRYPSSFLLNVGSGLALSRSEGSTAALGLPRAEAYFRAALALRPDLPSVYVQLSNVNRRTGNYVHAVRFGKAAVRMAPGYQWDNRKLAFDMIELGREEEAIQWFERSSASEREAMIQASRFLTGQLPKEDYLAWLDQQDLTPPVVISTGYMLLFEDDGIGDPQATRDLIEAYLPEVPGPIYHLYLLQSLACLFLEDAPAALEAALEMEKSTSTGDRSTLARAFQIQAVAQRMMGDEALAQISWRRARMLREELFAGLETDWKGSTLDEDATRMGSLWEEHAPSSAERR